MWLRNALPLAVYAMAWHTTGGDGKGLRLTNRIVKLKELFTRQSLRVMIGYCLYKAVAFHSYTTDFALLNGAYGYISSLPFMAGASVGLIGTSVCVLVLVGQGRFAPLSMPFKIPLAVLAAGYVVALFLKAPPDVVLLVLGLAWGIATSLVTMCWMEIFALEDSPMVLILQFSAAMFVSAVIASLARAFVPEGSAMFCLAMIGVCCAIMVVCRRTLAVPCAAQVKGERVPACGRLADPTFKQTLKKASSPLLAWGFFELIVGLVNMYAYRDPQSSFSIFASAPIESMLICAILIVVFVFVTNKAPNPSFIFLFVFPCLIGMFMLLPFFGEQFGQPMSVVIYVAYVSTSTLSNFWYIRVAHDAREHIYPLAALANGGVRIMLLIGLALGTYFSSFREGASFVHLSIIAVVCVYCLVLVVVLWGYANSKNKQRTVIVTESFEAARSRKIDEVTADFDLTPREKDVLSGLAQGHTARGIAGQLGISTSTVQSHIKSLYAKLGVNKKQQVLDLFDLSALDH